MKNELGSEGSGGALMGSKQKEARQCSSGRYASERFNYVACQQAPLRAATAIACQPSEVTILLECGHVVICAPHFSYKLGEEHRCRTCGVARAAELPEFKV